MEQFLTGYREFLQNISKSSHTIKQYILDARHFIHFWQQNEELLFQEVSKQYRAHLIEKYAISSANRKLAGTRKFVLFMYDRQYITAFDDSVFEPLEKNETKLNYLTKAHLKQVDQTLISLINNASNEEEQFLAARHYAMFYVFVSTGIKPFEAIQMKWEHIEGNMLTVLYRNNYRVVQLTPIVEQALKALKAMNSLIFGENEFIWLGLGNRRGEPITEKTIERFFKMLSNYVGFQVTATMCRYTCMKYEEDNLFEKLGYTRKDNMKERLKKLEQ